MNIPINWSDKELLWLLCIILLIFLIRLPVLNVSVLDWDESMYWTIAQDVVNGGVPYKTAWDNKGPLLFLVFVPVIMLFENSVPALRIFTTLYLILSMYCLYLTGGYLFPRHMSNSFIRLIPPLIYGLFFVIPDFQGFASNGELIMMLPVILSLLFYLSYATNGNLGFLFLSGVFSSAAVFVKGSAVFSVLVVPIMIVYSYAVPGLYDFKSFVTKTLCYSLGIAAPFIILSAYFWSNGALNDFYYAFFTANGSYIQMIPLSEGLINTYDFMRRIVTSEFEILTLLALLSAVYIIVELTKERFDQEAGKRIFYFILALFVLSFLGVLSGRRMYSHYYLQMALPYSLVISFAITKLRLSTKRIKAIIVAVTLLVLVQSPLHKVLAYNNKIDLRRTEKYRLDHIESYDISRYIRNNTKSDEKILVLGGQPIIYFLSDRRSPIKVFWWNDNHIFTLRRITNFEGTFLPKLRIDKPSYVIVYEGEDKRQTLGFEYFGKFIFDNYTFETTIGNYKLYRLNEAE